MVVSPRPPRPLGLKRGSPSASSLYTQCEACARSRGWAEWTPWSSGWSREGRAGRSQARHRHIHLLQPQLLPHAPVHSAQGSPAAGLLLDSPSALPQDPCTCRRPALVPRYLVQGSAQRLPRAQARRDCPFQRSRRSVQGLPGFVFWLLYHVPVYFLSTPLEYRRSTRAVTVQFVSSCVLSTQGRAVPDP